jgi:RNA polymerase sigma factor (sigma-70 family)
MEVACRRAPGYDPARGASFLSYVFPDARSAMRDANAKERTRIAFEQEIARQSASRLEHDEPPASTGSRQRAERVAIGANAALAMHDEPSSPEDELIALEENERKRRRLAEAMVELDDVERMLIELVYWGDETIADVSRAIGKPYKWTYRRYEGAMEKLKRGVR